MLSCCLIGLALAGEANIYPNITGYVEQVYTGSYTYSRAIGLMCYGERSASPGVGTDHAFLRFGLDSLPDSIAILSAALVYDQYEHTNGLPVVDIKLIHDPMSLSPHDLYFHIGTAGSVTAAGPSSDTWNTWNFDSTAGPLLDSCHRVGTASFAIHWSGPPADTFIASAYGYDSSAAPYLHIIYRSLAILETPNVHAARPLLTLSPNPTRSAFVVANHPAARSALTLRNALGRIVKSFPLSPSVRTRLDLRGLAPGVYMATVDGPSPSITRKLVIPAR